MMAISRYSVLLLSGVLVWAQFFDVSDAYSQRGKIYLNTCYMPPLDVSIRCNLNNNNCLLDLCKLRTAIQLHNTKIFGPIAPIT